MPLLSLKHVLIPLAALAAAVAISGCDLSSNADKSNGMQLFTTKCGICHTLTAAGTTAKVGPDLDAAFAQARANGMDSDTFEGIVLKQISEPRPGVPDNPSVSMPPDLVKGEDAKDVAAYVASVAGVPGIKGPTIAGGPGAQVFAAQGCGSCHTLKAANSSGTIGPDLDTALKGQSATEISQSITDPGAKITPGFPGGVMPSTFKSLPPDQLKALVAFLIKSASGK